MNLSLIFSRSIPLNPGLGDCQRGLLVGLHRKMVRMINVLTFIKISKVIYQPFSDHILDAARGLLLGDGKV